MHVGALVQDGHTTLNVPSGGLKWEKKNIQSRKVYCNEAVGIAKWSYVNSYIY